MMDSTISKIDGLLIVVKPSPTILATWYAEQVIAGNIVACKKVVRACERHLNDLQKQGTDDFPWIFNEEIGHRPIQFIEKFCKPSKGAFNQLIMQAWQHFTLGSCFGWVDKDTGLRRFKEALILVARKQGKTTKIAGATIYGASKDGEKGADVVLLANSMKQARLLFDEAKAMIKSSPALAKRFRPLRDAIHFDSTFSKIEPQASDSEKLDGLNTHIGVFDEIHEYKDYKLINVIKNSRQSREQPLLIYITTAGYQLDGPLVNYYEQGTDVLNGDIVDDRTFYYIAELDSVDEFDNPEMWIKANPNMNVSVKLADMIEDWEKAKRTPSERNDFITKRFNKFVSSNEASFLDYEVLKRNDKTIDYASAASTSLAVGGFDLSDSEDHTSAYLEWAIPSTGEIVLHGHTWVPQAKVDSDNEKIDYQALQEEGLLTIVPGEYVKKEYVFDWFVEQSKLYPIEKIMYDPAKAFGLVEMLQGYGFICEVVRQGFITLGPALDDAKERFIDGNVIFNNNRLFRWYTNNVVLIEDRNKNRMPTKQSRYRKIDGFAAFLNAHVAVMKKFTEVVGNGEIKFISLNDL